MNNQFHPFRQLCTSFPLPLCGTFICKVLWEPLPYLFGLCGCIMFCWGHLQRRKALSGLHSPGTFLPSSLSESLKLVAKETSLRDGASEKFMEGQCCHNNLFYWFLWYLHDCFDYTPVVCKDSKKVFRDSSCTAVVIVVTSFLYVKSILGIWFQQVGC